MTSSLLSLSSLRSSFRRRRLLSTARSFKGIKRFYDTVDVVAAESDGGKHFDVTLDGRVLKSPAQHPFHFPTEAAALLVATEWASQTSVIVPPTMPTMTLASSAVDQMQQSPSMDSVYDELIQYLHGDTTCYQDTEDAEEVIALQAEHWDPLHAWMADEMGAPLDRVNGIAPTRHDEASVGRVRNILSDLNAWELSAVLSMTTSCKSLVVALAVLHGKVSAEQAVAAARVDEEYQLSRWGLVEGGHDVDRAHINVKVAAASSMLMALEHA